MSHLHRSADGRLIQHHQFKESTRSNGNRNFSQGPLTTQNRLMLVHIYDSAGNNDRRKSANSGALQGSSECLNAVWSQPIVVVQRLNPVPAGCLDTEVCRGRVTQGRGIPDVSRIREFLDDLRRLVARCLIDNNQLARRGLFQATHKSATKHLCAITCCNHDAPGNLHIYPGLRLDHSTQFSIASSASPSRATAFADGRWPSAWARSKLIQNCEIDGGWAVNRTQSLLPAFVSVPAGKSSATSAKRVCPGVELSKPTMCWCRFEPAFNWYPLLPE
jgi:hypothetical protein